MASEAVARVLERLENVRQDGTGWSAKCPAHDDQRNSLHVAPGDDGRALIRCHAGCQTQQVVHKAGLAIADLFTGRPAGRRGDAAGAREWGKVVATYDYVDANNALLYQVLRDEHKSFRQRRPSTGVDPGEDQWTYDLNGTPRVLYRLPEVRAAVAHGHRVFVVEGEKDADALSKLGLIATTNAGGAGAKWLPEYTAELQAAADVVIVPDNDEVGKKHASAVAGAVAEVAKRVSVLDLPGLPPKGDVSDFIETGGTREALNALADACTPIVPPSARFTSIAFGAYAFSMRELEPPRSILGDGILARGDLAFLYGRPGLGKTWAALQFGVAAVRGEPWFGMSTPTEGIRVGILELELNAYLLRQRLVAVGGLSERDDGFTIVARPDLKGAIDVLDDVQWSAWGAWCTDASLDLLIVDALSRVHHVDENHAADFSPVLGRFDQLRHDTGTAVLIVHHEPKPPSGRGFADDMDALRGTSRMASDANVLMRLVRVGQSGGPLSLRFPKVNNSATPAPVYLGRHEAGPLFVTDPPQAKGDKVRARILEELRSNAGAGGVTAEELQKRVGLGRSAIAKHLKTLGAGRIQSGREAPRYLPPVEDPVEGAA